MTACCTPGTVQMTIAVQRQRLARIGISPGGLSLIEAAAYVGLSGRTFSRQVAAGSAPVPLRLSCRRRLWSKAGLDAWLAGHSDAKEDGSDPIMKAIEHAKSERVT